jgi:2-isopropylmalate synthase
MEEEGRIATGQSADADTVVASVRAYVNALNRLDARRRKVGPGSDAREVSYRDAV